MKRYVIRTDYWRPQWSPFKRIIQTLNPNLQDHDIIVISEKALSTITGKLIDESQITPGRLANWIARIWMRIVWGYFLSTITRLNQPNTERLRTYPLYEGARHKHLILTRIGFLHSLKHWSEGGVDATNLPYSLVSLPLDNPREIAWKIRTLIKEELQRDVTVIIADSDKTFTFRNIHITSRKTEVKGIYNLGPLAFIIGRLLKMKARSTPIAVSTQDRIRINEILNLAASANKARGIGSGATVWDSAFYFKTNITEVTWDMLETVDHHPIVIFRKSDHPSRS